MQHLGLVGAYEEHDGRFAMSVRCVAALAFVPENDVEMAFESLMRTKNSTTERDLLPITLKTTGLVSPVVILLEDRPYLQSDFGQ